LMVSFGYVQIQAHWKPLRQHIKLHIVLSRAGKAGSSRKDVYFLLGCLDSSHARPDCECHMQSVSSYPSPYAYLKAHITSSMAFLSISHMPFLSLGSNHLPNGSIVRARSSQDVPANSRKASTLQSRQLYLRYLHLHPASQIT